MEKIQKDLILKLTKKLSNIFGPNASKNIQLDYKADKSLVTVIDIFVSALIKEGLRNHSLYSNYNFFSEEDFDTYDFPCAILDPIDGTRELVRGRPECAVSLALMKNPDIDDPENFAWIYNPFSGFSLDTQIPYVVTTDKSIQKILTFVSRSEFHKGHYEKYLDHPQLVITPRGSIAFKLGLLASGACDFIISLEPKNVWDIAAGTILCAQRGIHFYENGKRMTSLTAQTYSGPLIWAPEFLAPTILKIFEDEFENEIK